LKNETPAENLDKTNEEIIPDKTETPEPEKNFATQRESIEDLNPEEIQPFHTILDYLEPTSSLYPIVVKTPASITCIEGWPLVQEAKETGQPTLTCHIHQVTEVSKEELAIRKVAIRVFPQGGLDRYPERVRNVAKLSRLLTESTENPIILSRGGDRKGKDFTANRDENIRVVLAERLGISRATIGKYLNHAENINNDAMQALVEGKADKDFFEAFQKVKRKLVGNLKDDGVPEEDITRQVSEAVLRMHRDPQEIDNLWNSLIQAPSQQNTNTTQNMGNASEGRNGQDEEEDEEEQSQAQDHFDPWTGNQESPEGQPPSEQETRARGIEIAERMKGDFENQSLTLPEIKERVNEELRAMVLLLAEINSHEELSSETPETV
jgi:hypothetical protein